jgi:hypothetical protein
LINLVTQAGDTLITDADEELIASYQVEPLYQWHCREFSDRTTKICSSLAVANDLVKGDGVTEATFPIFVATDTDTGTPSHYVFDGVNDQVGNWPTMPTEYTVVAIVDDGSGPELWTCNDTEIEDALTASGTFSGKLYRLAIFDEVLDAEQLEFLEYHWVSKVPRAGARGIEHRLILDGSCVLNHRYLNGDSDDITDNSLDGVDTDVAYSDDGAWFNSDTSVVTVPYDAKLQLSSDISVVFTAKVLGSRKIIGRGTNYEINITPTPDRFYFKASGVSRYQGITLDSEFHHYAVTCVSGAAFLLWMDGQYIGDGSGNTSLATAADNLTIGSVQVSGDTCVIKDLKIFNRVLSENEIKALYHRSKIG